MRKLVVFVLIFALGLATILWWERLHPGRVDEPAQPTPPTKVEDQPLTEVDIDGGERQAKSVEFVIEGPFDHIERDPSTLKKHYELHAKDTRPLGSDAYDLFGFRASVFDTRTEDLRGTATAATARVRISPNTSGVDFAYPITLTDAVLRAERDLPLAPVTVTLPVVEGVIAEGRLTSKERVDIVGQGLTAHGDGLVLDARARSLKLVRNTFVDLELGQNARATLTSLEGLEMRRLPDVPGSPEVQVEIEAHTQAVLDITGAEPLHVESDRILLRGVMPAGSSGRFIAQSATAVGSAVLTLRRERFTGDRAFVEFDVQGRPKRATLEGAPSVRVPLDAPPSLAGVAGGSLQLEADGAGPLEVSLDDPPSFTFAGPATVRVPELDLVLEARGSLAGRGEKAKSYSDLTALGGATLTARGSYLTAPTLVLTSDRAPDDSIVGRLTTRGETYAYGALEDGRAWVLETERGIQVVRAKDEFRVPRAECVSLRVWGKNGFTAAADQLSDFDSTTLTFVAARSVVFENELGRGIGERLNSYEGGVYELSGSPARLEFPEGSIVAKTIEYDSRRMIARGDAEAHVRLGERKIDLDGDWLAIERDPPLVAGALPQVSLDARGLAHAIVEEPAQRFEIAAGELRLRGEQRGPRDVEAKWLEALGAVTVDYRGIYELHGSGERFTVSSAGLAHLEPLPGSRAQLSGTLPKEALGFHLAGDSIDFTSDRLDATNAELDVDGVPMPLSAPSRSDAGRHLRAVAGHMTCTRESLLFSDTVYLGGLDPSERGWSLDAEQALITSTKQSQRPGFAPSADVLAWGNCVMRMGDEVEAHGDTVRVSRAENRAELDGEPAFVLSKSARMESEHLEWNLETNFVRSTGGFIRALDESWRIDYQSLDQLEGLDETIQVLREPRFTVARRAGDEESVEFTRAGWMLCWVDHQEWTRLSGQFHSGESPRPNPSREARRRKRRETPSLFTLLEARSGFADLLDEVYLEGNIETFDGDTRVARADSVYLDYADGHGWIENAEVTSPMNIRGRHVKLRAQWLRHSADGSFRADQAVITSCDFAKPHYQIKTADLRLGPSTTRANVWDVSIRGNAIVFENGWSLPLPRIAFPMKPKKKLGEKTLSQKGWDVFSFRNLSIDAREASIGGVRWLRFGSQARFGTFVGTEIDFEPGAFLKWIDKWLSGLNLRGPKVNGVAAPEFDGPDGGTSIRPQYLNKRGLLLGLEGSLHREGVYDADLNIDGIYDTGEDRGLVRVDDDDRSSLRAWYHARARYFYDEDTWLDVVYSKQTDAGVQSEFFESEFLRFEERENYVHWRKSLDGSLVSATAETRLDSFRTEVVEQPSFDFYRGRSEVAELAGTPLLYSSNTQFAQLSRLEGNPQYEKPFADGLGERDTLRFDTRHRVELNKPLGVGGLIATPWIEGRATGWQEGVDPTTNPSRGLVLAGIDLATTFWRRYAGAGYLHELSPQVTLRSDLATSYTDGLPVSFDEVERPFEGSFVDMRVRSRLVNLREREFLDVELAQSHANATAAGEPEGWLPIETAAAWLTQVGDVPFAVSHDGRYDLESGETVYSRTYFGLRPMERLDLETGYNSARGLGGDRLYDALTIGARYRFDSDRAVNKWELEGRETISQTSGRLSSSITARRFGHDFVFEIELSFVAGEGANNIKFNLVPLLGYRSPNLGLLDRWRNDD
ncbi:MAG: hypothetical protein IT453_08255 [Planctomycetes bacterium]|nr:hypothetical protein [Planctomycetota bacterium]